MIRIRRLLTVSLALAFLAGCDASGEKEKKGSSMETRLKAAQDLMDEAKAAGAEDFASAEFELFAKKVEDSQKLIDDGKGDKASTKISSATSGFKELIQRASELKKSQAAAAESKKKVETAIAAAKKQQIDAEAPEAWEEVVKLLDKANADLADPKKVSGVPSTYNEVLNRLKLAKQTADEAKMWKEKAEAQKKVTKEREGKAVEARVSEQDLAVAQQSALEADKDLENKKYREAFELYQRADQGFAEAISRAKEAKEMALANQPPDAQNPQPAPAPEEPAPDAGKVEKKEAAEEPAGPEAAKVGEGELSADDEDFLVKNIAKFSSKRPVEYDPGAGTITVEYPFGDEMKKDLIFPRGIDPKNIGYKDPIMQTGSKEAKGQKEIGLTFTGNTLGFFLLPFPFKDSLTIEYKVQIGMMKSEGTMTAVLMSSKDARSYIGANFGTIEAWRDGRRIAAQPPQDPKYKGSPNKWFSKIKLGGVGMRIQLEPHKDGKRGMMKIFYDTADEGDEAPITASPVPRLSGFAGFSWFATKFNVSGLKISGKLDKQAAVKLLREKLGGGAGEETPAPKGPKAPKKETPGAEENAGAPAAGAGDKKDSKKTANAKKAGSEGDQADY